jgi:hypothetical protein
VSQLFNRAHPALNDERFKRRPGPERTLMSQMHNTNVALLANRRPCWGAHS